MSAYAESSAILAWLLGESSGDAVRSSLAAEDLVVTSEITRIECERTLIRAASAGVIREVEAADLGATLRRAAAHWTVFPLEAEISDRAGRRFPREPVRSLDAIHLATAVLARGLVPGLRMVSLDERVRRNAEELGFEVAPT